jgi:glycerol-3-phosphate acyltransferase PlsY
MNPGRLTWVVGGYLAGTIPSALLVARAKRATAFEAAARRRAGEGDAHIVLWKQLGVAWMAVAATMDVLKGFLFALAARHWGHLPAAWLAAGSFAVVLGHTFPPYARQMAGRGLAAAAGVYLALLPVEMVVAGLLIVLGGAIRATSPFTTVGMASAPVVAAAQGQPRAFVAMAAAVFVLLMARRLEGLSEVIASGISPGRAVLYRCVFDSSMRPSMPHLWFRQANHEPSTDE